MPIVPSTFPVLLSHSVHRPSLSVYRISAQCIVFYSPSCIYDSICEPPSRCTFQTACSAPKYPSSSEVTTRSLSSNQAIRPRLPPVDPRASLFLIPFECRLQYPSIRTSCTAATQTKHGRRSLVFLPPGCRAIVLGEGRPCIIAQASEKSSREKNPWLHHSTEHAGARRPTKHRLARV